MARCLITGTYGALGTKTGMPTLGATTLSVVLDPGPPRDTFFIKLNAGKGGGCTASMTSLASTD